MDSPDDRKDTPHHVDGWFVVVMTDGGRRR
jgi:hypothetical protein